MFPLKVQRGAVRRGICAPQAAPGLPKAGGAAGKEGGRRRASAGRRRRRPPARRKEAEKGWGRRVRPQPQDAATMDVGPDPSRPRASCGAGRPGGAREAPGALRRALAPAAADPASRTAPLGPGLRSPALLAAVETMEGGRAQARPAPPPPPPRRLNPFAAPAASSC